MEVVVLVVLVVADVAVADVAVLVVEVPPDLVVVAVGAEGSVVVGVVVLVVLVVADVAVADVAVLVVEVPPDLVVVAGATATINGGTIITDLVITRITTATHTTTIIRTMTMVHLTFTVIPSYYLRVRMRCHCRA